MEQQKSMSSFLIMMIVMIANLNVAEAGIFKKKKAPEPEYSWTLESKYRGILWLLIEEGVWGLVAVKLSLCMSPQSLSPQPYFHDTSEAPQWPPQHAEKLSEDKRIRVARL